MGELIKLILRYLNALQPIYIFIFIYLNLCKLQKHKSWLGCYYNCQWSPRQKIKLWMKCAALGCQKLCYVTLLAVQSILHILYLSPNDPYHINKHVHCARVLMIYDWNATNDGAFVRCQACPAKGNGKTFNATYVYIYMFIYMQTYIHY